MCHAPTLAARWATTSGLINNYTGTGINGPDGIVAGPDGAMWFSNQSGNSIGRITTNVTPQINGFTPTSDAPDAAGPPPRG